MTTPDFHIAVDTSAEYPIILVRGELDHLSIERFERAAQEAAEWDRGVVILSLLGATYFDSLTVHAIMAYRVRLDANRQRLVLVVGHRGTPRRILEIVGVTARVPTFTTVEEALAAAPALSLRSPANE